MLDDAAGASLAAGLLNKLGVVPEVVVAAVAGAADEALPPPSPPPMLGNKDELDDAVVVGVQPIVITRTR